MCLAPGNAGHPCSVLINAGMGGGVQRAMSATCVARCVLSACVCYLCGKTPPRMRCSLYWYEGLDSW